MTPFFNAPEKIRQLRDAAKELIGTPFVPHAMVPGAGIDCVHVNAWCYLQTSFLKKFEPPKYALDSGSHAKESQLLKWLDEHENFSKINKDETLQAGDTICFNLGLSEHHVGLMTTDNEFIHVLPRRFVIASNLFEYYYSRRITAVYRPVILESEASDVR